MLEQVLIIAVKRPNQAQSQFQSSLQELKSLVKSAGGEVQSVFTQNRRRIHPALYIGEGKAKEIKQTADEMVIDLVISNDELSAGQLRNLGNLMGLRIIDRSQLILDIFAKRARTKEGKLQVELAQLAYLLPRLHGQGTQLSRLGAGIGTRGPGETKLETDQRHIRKRISDIKQRLNSAVTQRLQYRNRRKHSDVLQIAIVGYTNAGKSTIFNQLSNSDSLTEDKLFATLDPMTRKVVLPSGFAALITDTVGFIQDLPTALIAAFRSTLEEVNEADLILHVIDGSNPDHLQHQQTVDQLICELGAKAVPALTIYNKRDLFTEDLIAVQHPYVVMSAFLNEDTDLLKNKLEDVLKDLWEEYAVALPAAEIHKLYRLQKKSIIVSNFFEKEFQKYLITGYIKDDNVLEGIIREKKTDD